MTAKEVIVRLKGWYEVRHSGSHKQFKHDSKTGLVTVPVHGKKDLPKGTLASLSKTGGMEIEMLKEFIVIYERGGEGEEAWGAYVPDLPGCVSTGDSLDEVQRNIKEALQLHLEGLKSEGLPVPEPTTRVDKVSVAA